MVYDMFINLIKYWIGYKPPTIFESHDSVVSNLKPENIDHLSSDELHKEAMKVLNEFSKKTKY